MLNMRALKMVQFSSVAQSCPTLCDPMNGSTPGLPVHHQLPEFTQTHVHRVGDAIQPSHPLSSPSPPAHNPSQHQSLFFFFFFYSFFLFVCFLFFTIFFIILFLWVREISPGCSAEGLMLKLKLQYFGLLMRRVDSLEKTLRLEGLGAGGEGDDRG